MLSLSIIGVTASGNIINDLYDVKSDSINNRNRPIAKSEISHGKAKLLYGVIVAISITLGFVFSYGMGLWWLLMAEVLSIFLLFTYARYLKGIALLGNLIVSLLVSLSFMLLFFVEMPIALTNLSLYWMVFYGVFAFWTNLNREIVKDVSDMKGDYAQGLQTLPLLIGKSRTNTVLFFSTSILVIIMVLVVKKYLAVDITMLLYFIFAVGTPLGYAMYHIYRFEKKTNHKRLGNVYKMALFLGVLSMLLL
jgi:4-hydroxybenzoate polyprenyltransferase